jgi:hypothetical protein
MLKLKDFKTFESANSKFWRWLPLLFLWASMSISVSAFQVPKPRTRVLETLSTKAGVVKLFRVDDPGIGETNWYVTLRGKVIYRTHDDVFGSVGFHTIFKFGLGAEVILLQETSGGTPECTSFRLIEIRPAGRSTVSSQFGSCNNDPKITQKAATVTFSFSKKSETDPKNEVWTYQGGLLTRQ